MKKTTLVRIFMPRIKNRGGRGYSGLKSAIFDFVVKNLVFRPRRTANDYCKLTFDLLTLQKSNIRNIDQCWRSGATFEITCQIDPNSPDQRGYLGLVQELPIWIW